jgi:hypothetical protein
LAGVADRLAIQLRRIEAVRFALFLQTVEDDVARTFQAIV